MSHERSLLKKKDLSSFNVRFPNVLVVLGVPALGVIAREGPRDEGHDAGTDVRLEGEQIVLVGRGARLLRGSWQVVVDDKVLEAN